MAFRSIINALFLVGAARQRQDEVSTTRVSGWARHSLSKLECWIHPLTRVVLTPWPGSRGGATGKEEWHD
jgi:hypothetical protein